jgi:hypothetical protein
MKHEIEELEVKTVPEDANPDGTGESYRYRLELIPKIKVDPKVKGKTVCVVMQNPSKATAIESDLSVNKLKKMILDKELFGPVKKLVIVNQFARYQTKVDYDSKDDLFNDTDNDEHIFKAFENADVIIIAWGSSNKYRKRQAKIIRMLNMIESGKEIFFTKTHPAVADRNRYKDDPTDYFIPPPASPKPENKHTFQSPSSPAPQ